MQVYLIAEIGQNHNGSIEKAKQLIDMAAMPVFHNQKLLPGVNAVKFTVRDLEHEASNSMMDSNYHSKHAFAETYRKHRQALELSYDDIYKLRQHAKRKGLDFILTICQHTIVDKFAPLADMFKVASRDVSNIPLIEKLSKYVDKEIIISNGFNNISDIVLAVHKLKYAKVNILHCTSKYPTPYDKCDLSGIRELKEYFLYYKNVKRIGYSDHTSGILAPSIAVAMGAQMIEKHITLDRNSKGTDHAGSLEPEGLMRVIRDIRNAQIMLSDSGVIDITETREKIGRSLAVNKDIEEGHLFRLEDFIMVSPGTGHKWNYCESMIGTKAKRSYQKNDLV